MAFLSHTVAQQQFAQLCFGICLRPYSLQLLKLPGTFLLLVAACYHTLQVQTPALQPVNNCCLHADSILHGMSSRLLYRA